MRVERIGGAWKIDGVYYDPESVVQIAAELDTLRARLAEVEAENERLREWLESIADAYDARSDLFASEDDCAASLAARARAAIAQPKGRAAMTEPDKEKSHDDG